MVFAVAVVAVFLVVVGRGPQAPVSGECVAEPGAEQQDVDVDDSPEAAWEHEPGQEFTVYFATGGLPARYAGFVGQGAGLWSHSPCLQAVAVAECPEGERCSEVVAAESRRGRGGSTDGESQGRDRGGVRYGNTIRLYTDVLDRESDNGALATVVHEMGHALGLVHRNDRGSVMNAVTDDNTDPMPDAVDFANLTAIYGAPADSAVRP
ncbi:hypothetical protein BJF78_31360 [Pseudonocardia sp. CNS-139]|nr:hypothetical protein BJF78_31360 [Pseudonocardia sp. CNS-139]